MGTTAEAHIRATFRKVIPVLRDAGIPAMLAGGMAAWARGCAASEHDLDIAVRPQDAEEALSALVAADMRPERPPEPWLVKVWDGDVLVDLIFEPAGIPVDDEMFARGDVLKIEAIPTLVMAAEDILVTKLLSVTEQRLELGSVLTVARSLREQIDWSAVARRTQESPFAAGFFAIVDRLGVVDLDPSHGEGLARLERSQGETLSATEIADRLKKFVEADPWTATTVSRVATNLAEGVGETRSSM